MPLNFRPLPRAARLASCVLLACVAASGTAAESRRGAPRDEAAQLRMPTTAANAPPSFTGVPSITGDAAAGAVLGLAGVETSDPDGDTVTVTALWLVDGLPLAGETGMTLVVPDGLRGRSISAEVSASDGTSVVRRDTAGVVVGNAAPIARTDSLLISLTPSYSYPPLLLLNDVDPDGDALVASILSGPAFGTARVGADGSLQLTDLPQDGPYTDRLTYRACDPSGACATGTLHLEFEEDALAWREQRVFSLPSDHSVHDTFVNVLGDSSNVVAEVVGLRLAPSRAYGWFVPGSPGVREVRLPANPADEAASYAVHVEAYAGPGGDASLQVSAAGVTDPALACSGVASLRSTCTVQVVVPARSPGVTLRYAAQTLVPNSDAAIPLVVRHIVEPQGETGVHGQVAAVVGKRVEGFLAPVRLVADVAGVQSSQTFYLGTVEVRDGPGGALLGQQTLRFMRLDESPTPRALVPGRPVYLAVLPYQAYGFESLHERARLEVPAGATSAMVEVDAPVGVTGALVAPSTTPGDPRAQAVPLRPDAASTRVPLVRGGDGRLVALVEGDALVPGLWTLELADTVGSNDVLVRVDTTLALGAGAVPLRPGHYFNPGRDGHGVFLERGGTQMVAWWYTYRQDGSPIWYMAQADAPADGQPFAAEAYRVTWSLGGGATLYDVGQVAITPAADGSLGFAYEVDGATGHERLVSLSEGGCLPVDGVSVDGAGSWFSPERSGFGYSVMWDERSSQEIMVTYAYDAEGQPRWGYAQAPASTAAVASLPIVQLRGFAPDAAWQPLVNLGRIGTLRRTIGTMPQDGQPGLRRASVAMAFTGPVTGAFVQDLETALLTNRRACR